MIKKYIKTKIISKTICLITIQRPPVNALSTKLLVDLKDTFLKYNDDDNIRIIIVNSELNHFSAGADLKQRSIMTKKDSTNALNSFKDCFDAIENVNKITICAINGYCLGGGAELSLCFDIRVASDNAIIGFPEVGIGIIPGAGGTQRLPKIIGLSNAKYWIYTARKFKATEAFEYNFVNFITTVDNLENYCIEIAHEIIDNSPIGVICSKKAIDLGYGKDIKDGLSIERKYYTIAVNTEDRKEALKAFSDKRKPKWRNK